MDSAIVGEKDPPLLSRDLEYTASALMAVAVASGEEQRHPRQYPADSRRRINSSQAFSHVVRTCWRSIAENSQEIVDVLVVQCAFFNQRLVLCFPRDAGITPLYSHYCGIIRPVISRISFFCRVSLSGKLDILWEVTFRLGK